MQFNQYRQNVKQYMDTYYTKLLQEMKDRPESSYAVIFSEEKAAMERYMRNVLREMTFHLEDELEEHFSSEQVQRQLKQIQAHMQPKELATISYTATLTTTVQVSENTSHTTRQLKSSAVIGTSVVSGGVVGGIVGGVIGTTAAMAAAGGVIGGAAVSAIAYYYAKEKRAKINTNPVRVPLSVPAIPSLASVIEQRQKQLYDEVLQLIDRVEAEYRKILGI